MSPYQEFVRQFVQTVIDGSRLPLGGFSMPTPRPPLSGAPRALIFSPHPDDEVIVGGLPLRLARERGWEITNVAVTQGSNKGRQAARWEELKSCCEYVGFGLVQTATNGLEGVNVKTRAAKPDVWQGFVRRIAEILSEHQPRVILFPHDDDWNLTHIGTHHLLVDALRQLGPGFRCFIVETEFWGAMRSPNLLVESSEQDVVDLITALSFHVGEVKRNPYHLRMPAWLMDNVRRGGELVGGQGGLAPDFTFGTLYRLRLWERGGFVDVLDRGRFVSRNDDVAELLG